MPREQQKQSKPGFTISEVEVVDRHVNLDGNRFEGVHFKNCALVYGGGIMPVIQGCTTSGCTWGLGGAADRTQRFLQQLVENGQGAMVAEMLGITREDLDDDE